MENYISLNNYNSYEITINDEVIATGTLEGYDIESEDFDFDAATATIAAENGLTLEADGEISMNDFSTSLAWEVTAK